ncbi:E3 ubiquitin-protein ligase RSL1-like [Salvia hispanica]|uniref:E3 ubiquitin-protein ligase RSL1-like n=1 Tax=Salvia hispanica TaxID=49212 RepID=UPI002008F8F1|nr:E3 ubiquitin-protein ligase RSL1-like [Salvia hispanica]
MATQILQIRDDDDEITIISSTPPPLIKSGATKSDAISVETYRPTPKITMDLDDVVEVPASSFTKRRKSRRFYRGESSNSKPLRLSFSCEICACDKPISDSFNILGCDHSYCTQCVSNYVAARLQESITAIGCPVPGCAGFLEPQHCRTILPREVFDRWGDALCEALILGAERFYCPYKECSALLIADGSETVVQSECPECRRLFCAPCKVAWHAGIECDEFQRLKKDERSNEDLKLIKLAKDSKWIRCPSCRIYISKSEGCLYMRCRCGMAFCYNCGAKMDVHLHYCTKCKH